MVKHNNVVPNVHLRKHWQKNVTTWLDQATKKRSRLITRRNKALAQTPRPLDKLRPVVRGQTIRYNNKTKFGRGFTLAEVKAAGLGVQFARSIGVTVDHRRKNRSQESLDLNKSRLLSYLNKLVLYPRNDKQVPTGKGVKAGIFQSTPKVIIIIKLGRTKHRCQPSSERSPTFNQKSEIRI
jgi:large subunit ribosomal protein L13e